MLVASDFWIVPVAVAMKVIGRNRGGFIDVTQEWGHDRDTLGTRPSGQWFVKMREGVI